MPRSVPTWLVAQRVDALITAAEAHIVWGGEWN
jgi:hypothetical protein